MKILHAIHDFLPRHRAGSEIYASHLCRELSRRHQVTVLCAEYDPSRQHGSVTRRIYEGLPVVELVNNWAFSNFDETYQSDALNQSLSRVLAATSPDVLHIHNLLNLSMDLPALARKYGIPSVATLHDYTLLCPSGGQRVHIAEQHVCHVIDPDRCSRCFPQSPFFSQMSVSRVTQVAAKLPSVMRLADVVRRRLPSAFSTVQGRLNAASAITVADITRRLDKARQVFHSIDLFVAPSQALANEYQALGLPAEKIRVSDYGFVPMATPERTPSAKLRLGFVGTLTWHKGAHVLIEAVRGLPADSYELKLFGDENVFPGYVHALRERARGLPVQFMGGFEEARTREIYSEIDVLVVPSLWPENSPLVIHEAFMTGVPVVGARQGGIPELVTHDVNGLIYEAYSPDALTASLLRLIDDPALVNRFSGRLPGVKSIEQDATEWEAIYEGLTSHTAAAQEAHRTALQPARMTTESDRPRIAAVVLNYRTPDATISAVRSLETSSRTLDVVVIVDNGSADGSAGRFRSEFPDAVVLETGVNLGFSGGCNVGIREALARGADLVWLLNSDVVVTSSCLELLEGALITQPAIGIIGPLLLSQSNPDKIESAGIRFSSLTGRMRHHNFGAPASRLPLDSLASVDGLSAAVMLVKKQVFEAVGLLREEYFFSFEDLDFCLRARDAGFGTLCDPQAWAYHAGSSSMGRRSARRLYFAARNHLLLASGVKKPSSPVMRLGRSGWIVTLNIAHALWQGEVPVLEGLGAVGLGTWHHVRRRYGDWSPLLGTPRQRRK